MLRYRSLSVNVIRTRTGTVYLWLLLIAAAFIGLGSLGSDIADARATEHWAVTGGTWVSRPELLTSAEHGIDVRYRYTVGGKQYEQRNVWYDGMGASADEASRAYRTLARVSSPRVYYDPSDPSRAVLVRGQRPSRTQVQWIVFACGVALIVVGFLVIVTETRRAREGRRQDR